ncbi:MAG: putative periplasmic/secreted protein [Edaphobacter sp.]|nr:putative periplasmic/secreted protein [Edaphobacter sp.]
MSGKRQTQPDEARLHPRARGGGVNERENRKRSLAKGLLAGLVGGLVATVAKSLAERVYPPRTHGEPEPPVLLAEKVAKHGLTVVRKETAAETIHWGFGAATGAAYGALAEYLPIVTQKDGASFGLALVTLTHEGALPVMGLSAPPSEQTPRERTSEMASHVVYGIVTETVRRVVRRMLR